MSCTIIDGDCPIVLSLLWHISIGNILEDTVAHHVTCRERASGIRRMDGSGECKVVKVVSSGGPPATGGPRRQPIREDIEDLRI
jgi:hypothetical protein